MDEAMVTRLRSDDGVRAMRVAAEVDDGRGELAAVTTLRDRGIDPALASAAFTQHRLRRKAVAKLGPEAARLLFTRAGLEQATRTEVADRRARRLAEAGVRRIADLGCGIGADTLAFARAGIDVLAIEADPATAAIAAANAVANADSANATTVAETTAAAETIPAPAVSGAGGRAFGRIDVRCADATTVDLSEVDAVFCDPARRSGVTGQRVFDPNAYRPSWSFVVELLDRFSTAVLKLAPGLDHSLIPAGSEAEWVSVNGDVVELAIWSASLRTVAHRATVLRETTAHSGATVRSGAAVHSLGGSGRRVAAIGPISRFLYDLDGAVVRAHLVAEAADLVGGHVADPRIAYVFGDTPIPTPYGRCFEILDEVPFAVKHLRGALRERSIGVLEIRTRGVATDPDQLRRSLGLRGRKSATLVLTRIGEHHTALLCQPVAAGTR